MNYSEWLKSTYPQLASENDVKVFSYVQQAKGDTKTARLFVLLLNIMLVGLLGYTTGYVFGKYTEFEYVIPAMLIVIAAAISFYITSRIEQRLIKRKLTELIGQAKH